MCCVHMLLYYFQIKHLKQILADIFAEQGGERSNIDVLRGRQCSYAKFNASDVKATPHNL